MPETTTTTGPQEVFVTHRQMTNWLLAIGGSIVGALAVFAAVIWTSNASAQAENRKRTDDAVAKVEAKAKEIDAGVGEQLAKVEKRLTAKIDRQDKALDRIESFQRCQLDKRWCPAARELLSGDDDP